MHKIHRGDDVIVIAGKDKGRRGTVLKVLDGKRVVVESINIAKKHQKPIKKRIRIFSRKDEKNSYCG